MQQENRFCIDCGVVNGCDCPPTPSASVTPEPRIKVKPGMQMTHEYALRRAMSIKNRLSPFCEKIEIAGSIRRMKPIVNDIEIVLIPKLVKADLFGREFIRHPELVNLLKNPKTGELVQGDANEGSYLKFQFMWGHAQLDLFITDENRWGKILLTRTGPHEFCEALYGRLKSLGLKNENGYTYQRKAGGWETISTPEERDVFELANLPWMEPINRTKEFVREYSYIPYERQG